MPLNDWLDHHRHFIPAIPFVGAIAGKRAEDRPLLTKLLENALTAMLAAAIVLWRNDSLQDYRLDQVQQQVERLTQEVQALRMELLRHDSHPKQPLARKNSL